MIFYFYKEKSGWAGFSMVAKQNTYIYIFYNLLYIPTYLTNELLVYNLNRYWVFTTSILRLCLDHYLLQTLRLINTFTIICK